MVARAFAPDARCSNRAFAQRLADRLDKIFRGE